MEKLQLLGGHEEADPDKGDDGEPRRLRLRTPEGLGPAGLSLVFLNTVDYISQNSPG